MTKAINRLIRRQTEDEKQRKGTKESESDMERLFDSETTAEEAASPVNIQGISKTFKAFFVRYDAISAKFDPF